MFSKYERVTNEEKAADLLLTVTQGGVQLERQYLRLKDIIPDDAERSWKTQEQSAHSRG